jgi:hypothetical protein
MKNYSRIPHADIVVPRGGNNKVAIELIIKHVRRELASRHQDVVRTTEGNGLKLSKIFFEIFLNLACSFFNLTLWCRLYKILPKIILIRNF